MQTRKYGGVNLRIFKSREEMGRSAAQDAAEGILSLLEKKEEISCIFAAAPSQNEFLATLSANKDIPWNRIRVFHMDEYINLTKDSPALFYNFLHRSIWDQVKPLEVYGIKGCAEDIEAECKRYSNLLEQYVPDIVFMGIGENGHIAFNDPPVADFKDKDKIKVVHLEQACRSQQVNDGCFATIDEVPFTALTLTIPTLIDPEQIYCIVPGKLKAQAVANTLKGIVDISCPASILQTVEGVKMYIDLDAAALL